MSTMSRSSFPNPSSLIRDSKSFLQSFQRSGRKFALFQQASGENESDSSKAAVNAAKTLFVLDSSYNPPSKAHFTLACSAVTSATAQQQPRPHGLLLLFSTANADKAPKPASFEQRLAMMSCLLLDIRQSLSRKGHNDVSIDIGVTTEPYYVGKSQAIEGDRTAFPGNPKHVHIIGYDTVTRFLAPKYYQDYDPPLSALSPYFDNGHSLLVALRPETSSNNMRDAGMQAVDEQRSYVIDLNKGSLSEVGFKSQWAEQINVSPRSE